jgi:hypothetical protein
MDPVSTTLMYCFIGYYIGSDIWNYVKFHNEFNEIKRRLGRIESQLEYSVTSK